MAYLLDKEKDMYIVVVMDSSVILSSSELKANMSLAQAHSLELAETHCPDKKKWDVESSRWIKVEAFGRAKLDIRIIEVGLKDPVDKQKQVRSDEEMDAALLEDPLDGLVRLRAGEGGELIESSWGTAVDADWAIKRICLFSSKFTSLREQLRKVLDNACPGK